jgi:hypothetical protein
MFTMIEPWATEWSRLIYRIFHHEPFEPEASEWDFESSGWLSGRNGANSWIIFARDGVRFEEDFPELQILSIRLMMPFRYLVSGGVSVKVGMPGWTFRLWQRLENIL